MSQSRQYELVYIVPPETTEEALADLHAQIEVIVTRFEGTIDATENWGRRRLAYEIARQKEGVYVLELITGSGEMVKEIDRRLKVIDTVIRHLVVRVDEEMRVVNRRKADRDAAVAKRRVARGLPAEAAVEGGETGGQDVKTEAEVSHE
jgi:small subunit ribosomal protein S6